MTQSMQAGSKKTRQPAAAIWRRGRDRGVGLSVAGQVDELLKARALIAWSHARSSSNVLLLQGTCSAHRRCEHPTQCLGLRERKQMRLVLRSRRGMPSCLCAVTHLTTCHALRNICKDFLQWTCLHF